MGVQMRSCHLPVLIVLVGALAACTSAGGPDLSEMSFSDEPLLGKLVWYDLITDDAEAARSFYGGLFGWSFEKTRGPRGNDYYLVRDGGIYLGGVVPIGDPGDGSELSRWLPYASVADVDSSVARARLEGAEVAVEPLEVGLGRVAAVVDPQGAAFGLARSDIGDPDDATTAGAPGRVVWAELLADDAAAAASFYEAVVGYGVRTVERQGGVYTLLVADGRVRAGILPNPTDWKSQWLLYFGVADPAAAAVRAEALGGRILLAPTPEVRDGRIAIVSDPSGAVLVLRAWPIADEEIRRWAD
jgi:predicted enzyme related to lactoylglutathione lyase